jgi:hypothetical protein
MQLKYIIRTPNHKQRFAFKIYFPYFDQMVVFAFWWKIWVLFKTDFLQIRECKIAHSKAQIWVTEWTKKCYHNNGERKNTTSKYCWKKFFFEFCCILVSKSEACSFLWTQTETWWTRPATKSDLWKRILFRWNKELSGI